jgi:hypothetical protein
MLGQQLSMMKQMQPKTHSKQIQEQQQQQQQQNVSGSICKFFLEGYCKHGDRCKNIHPTVILILFYFISIYV